MYRHQYVDGIRASRRYLGPKSLGAVFFCSRTDGLGLGLGLGLGGCCHPVTVPRVDLRGKFMFVFQEFSLPPVFSRFDIAGECFGDIHFTVHSPPNVIIGSSPHNSNPFPSSARPSHLKRRDKTKTNGPISPFPCTRCQKKTPKHPWPWSCPATKSPDSAAYSEIVTQFFPGCRLLFTAVTCSHPLFFLSLPLSSQPSHQHRLSISK